MILKKVNRAGVKKGIEYWYDEYGTLFCDPIDQSNMVGGGHEEGRNTLENPQRLERVRGLSEGPIVLDYGCGHGLFVKFLQDNGITAIGYDKYTERNVLPDGLKYNVITLIECAEHLDPPFTEFDEMFNLLHSGGKVMIETSFSNWLTIEDNYVNPDAGHSCVWSHEGLTAMMLSKGFIEGTHFNRNVRIFVKP